jgi:hypothetical protein
MRESYELNNASCRLWGYRVQQPRTDTRVRCLPSRAWRPPNPHRPLDSGSASHPILRLLRRTICRDGSKVPYLFASVLRFRGTFPLLGPDPSGNKEAPISREPTFLIGHVEAPTSREPTFLIGRVEAREPTFLIGRVKA